MRPGRIVLGTSFASVAMAALLVVACSGNDAALGDRASETDAGGSPVDATTGTGNATPPAAPTPEPKNEPCTSAGALETVRCGACGKTQRFCTSAGVWEYGPCDGETGACRPGELRDTSCGNCGRQREICTDACVWTAVGSCAGEGACKPGALVRSREGCATGTRDLRCNDACAFEPASECAVDRCTTPGATESVRCGNCGSRTRFCTASGEWEYGPCSNEGTCAPGTSGETTCGNCGTQSRRCNDRCEWVNFGECTGAGECAPGATTRRTTGCTGDQTRPFTCSSACRFEPTGECTAQSRGRLGELCVNGTCDAPLVCDTTLGPGVCRRPCTDDNDCRGASGICTGSGRRVCSDACTPFTGAGCPTGTKCNFNGTVSILDARRLLFCGGIGSGRQGDRCFANADCTRDFVCEVPGDGGAGRCKKMCDASNPCASPLTCRTPLLFPGFPAGGDTLGWCE